MYRTISHLMLCFPDDRTSFCIQAKKNKNPGRKLVILMLEENEENIEESRKATNRFFRRLLLWPKDQRQPFFEQLDIFGAITRRWRDQQKQISCWFLDSFQRPGEILENFKKTTFAQKQAKNNLVTEKNISPDSFWCNREVCLGRFWGTEPLENWSQNNV